jgi:hypothetical protein
MAAMGLEQVSAELRAILAGETDAATFRHADHVRMGFEILRRHDFLDAAKAYSAALKDMAARTGNPGAYHETITVAFLALIAERMVGSGTFDVFAAANEDLFDKAVLTRWYAPERLYSAIARATFVLPRTAALRTPYS